jgi:hypothetical protein
MEYRCEKCKNVFISSERLDTHMARTTPCDKIFKCDKCDKIFGTNFNLKRHINRIKSCDISKEVSEDKDKFPCSYCNKSYKHASSLTKHMKTCAEKKQQDRQRGLDNEIKQLEIQRIKQDKENENDNTKLKKLELEIQLQDSKNKEIILHKYAGKEIPESTLQICNIERTLALMKKKLYKMEVKMKTLNSEISIIEETLEIKKQEIEEPVLPVIEEEITKPDSPIQNIEEPDSPTSTDGCVYLLREREFISLDQPVYKIGRSKDAVIRFESYPKGSKILFVCVVENMRECEKDIKDEFNKKFKNRKDIGIEYFEGPVDEMLETIKSIAC